MSTSSPPPVHPYINKFIKSEYNPNFNSMVPIKVLPKSLTSPKRTPSAPTVCQSC